MAIANQTRAALYNLLGNGPGSDLCDELDGTVTLDAISTVSIVATGGIIANSIDVVTSAELNGAVTCGSTLEVTGNITIADGANIIVNTTTGTQIGTAAGQKIGFYGATPVAKQTGVAVSAAAIHAALVSLGLIGA